MERDTFIKLSGLTAIGFLQFKNHELIEITPPTLHNSHGLFNIQDIKKNHLYIQRDLFNKNGLQIITENRISSIKISNGNIENFGVLSKNGFKTASKNLSAIALNSGKTTAIQIDSQSIIFSEYDSLTIEGLVMANNYAFIQHAKGEIAITSKVNQSLFIYKL
jgi:hypothetical protein